ncbi:MAG: phospho-N-acetylmuramoyl-pentapeptide-transferase [Lachnospiraceae bacterium]|nr:phospho-N-acetylmuramoyl-pentapeptide-transferase [Lachnospiraceae bacterium]
MVTASSIIPVLIAFAISAILGPVIIPVLTRMKMDQTERTLGVKSHLKKAGTPTMGGIILLIAVTVTSLIFVWSFPKIGPVLFLTVAFGLIGFLDDYLKVVKKRSDGLFPRQKFALQVVVTAVFCAFLVNVPGMSLALRLPFTGGKMADIGFWAYPLLFLAVIGTVNGVNFTDGLDGLASSVTIVVAFYFLLASELLEAGVSPIAAAVMGALMGFLLYNAFPAKVFMGDTGSLALGGFVAGMAYMLNMPLYILLVGLIYLVEVVSVMLQVGYFKYTKKKTGEGKRLFKMAPIHHHFELMGWSETRVVAVFTVVTTLLCLVGLLAL